MKQIVRPSELIDFLDPVLGQTVLNYFAPKWDLGTLRFFDVMIDLYPNHTCFFQSLSRAYLQSMNETGWAIDIQQVCASYGYPLPDSILELVADQTISHGAPTGDYRPLDDLIIGGAGL